MSTSTTEPRVPAWVWLFTGIVTGLFLAFLYYLTGVPVPDTTSKPEDNRAKVTAPTPAPRPPQKAYDFYDKLPTTTIRPSPSPSASPTPSPRAIEPRRPSLSGQLLMIQTGSFQNSADAQRRRAELLLLGFDVQVNQTTIPGSGTWHRVQIGPFESGPKLNEALSTLTQNRIDHLVIELR